MEQSQLPSRTYIKNAKSKQIKHQVLNAKFHEQEADIIGYAGIPGTVTIATTMAEGEQIFN